MEATLTSKGQLTLPKPARDELDLQPGSVFKVTVTKAGSITLTPLKSNPLSIAGVLTRLKTRGSSARENADANDAVGDHLAEMDDRIRRTGRSSAPKRR